MLQARNRRRGGTLVDLLVVIVVIGIFLAVIMPGLSCGPHHRMQCSNNLKQLGVGAHTFHDTQQQFPAALYNSAGDDMTAQFWPGDVNESLSLGPSWAVMLIPFIESGSLFGLLEVNTNPKLPGTSLPSR